MSGVHKVIYETPYPPITKQWYNLIDYCAKMCHGEIACLKIQDGQPVIAEIVKEKIKF